jgi:tetratricopeptide (TPR) repeat protein
MGLLYDRQGQYADAEPMFKRSLAIKEKTFGPNHPDVAIALINLASLYGEQARFSEAEPLHKRALAINEKALGPNHSDVAAALNNLANLYGKQGRYAEAEPLYKRSLMIREEVLGPNHPDVGISLNNLADLYSAQGRYADALPIVQRTISQTTARKSGASPFWTAHNPRILLRRRRHWTVATPSFSDQHHRQLAKPYQNSPPALQRALTNSDSSCAKIRI